MSIFVAMIKRMFLSPPVRMHGGLICITLRLDVIGPKVTCQKVISLDPFDLWSPISNHLLHRASASRMYLLLTYTS